VDALNIFLVRQATLLRVGSCTIDRNCVVHTVYAYKEMIISVKEIVAVRHSDPANHQSLGMG
jgi:hypothetical protein